MVLWKVVFVVALTAGTLAEYQIDEIEKHKLSTIIRKYCNNERSLDNAIEAENAAFRLGNCVGEYVNIFGLDQLFTFNTFESREHLTELVKSTCSKVPQIKTCIHNVKSDLQPCMPDYFNENNPIDQILDFICYNNGERFSVFVAENGFECIKQWKQTFGQCNRNAALKILEYVKKTYTYIPITDVKDLPLTVTCSAIDSSSTCILANLKNCESQVTANMYESLAQIKRRGSRCKDIPVSNN